MEDLSNFERSVSSDQRKGRRAGIERSIFSDRSVSFSPSIRKKTLKTLKNSDLSCLWVREKTLRIFIKRAFSLRNHFLQTGSYPWSFIRTEIASKFSPFPSLPFYRSQIAFNGKPVIRSVDRIPEDKNLSH